MSAGGSRTGHWGRSLLPQLRARTHLALIIAVAVAPVWLFAAYVLAQYALNERSRFERDARQTARQVALVVEAELTNLLTLLQGLSSSDHLRTGDYEALHRQAARLVDGTDLIILLRDFGTRQILNTQLPYAASPPPAVTLDAAQADLLRSGRSVIGAVYASPVSGEPRIPIAIPVQSQGGQLILAATVPTAHIRDILLPAVPPGWVVGVGDRTGTYVTRSQLHDDVTGKPGLPEYLDKAQGQSGTFVSRNLQGTTLLAGYWRAERSGWLYGANIPLAAVRAPLVGSLLAIGAIALLAMLISALLAYFVGKTFTRATGELAERAAAIGSGQPVTPMHTSVTEFARIGDAFMAAQAELMERETELQTVLETVPAAVWFTYDPEARRVIRNRYAAELMGLPVDEPRYYGRADMVIDTVAVKEGQLVGREDRPLTKAMRGIQTDNEEYDYFLPSGGKRHLLSSARSIYDGRGAIVGAVQISLDISERKKGEEQRNLLTRELNHRVKNTLAIVQSIAMQTLRTADSLEEARESISRRLVSLGKAHDILTRESWHGASLDELVSASISAQLGGDRIAHTGPSVWLQPSLALSLSLVLHELATNAVKYGALSNATGRVTVTSSVEPGTPTLLRMRWAERDGPAVAPPTRHGFGTRMFSRILAVHAGKVELFYRPDGLLCLIEAQLKPADDAESVDARSG